MTDRQSGLELACWMSQLLDRKGGRGIFVLDVRGLSSITDFFVIVTGTSSTHMQTLIDSPVMELKKLGFPPQCVEGRSTGWVVADFSDVLLHVFDEGTRQHYNLEELWKEAPRIDWEHLNQNSIHAVSQ